MTMPETILLIEDDESFRSSLKLFLADQGFTVLEAADAAGAMDIFERQRPDLVLLDLGIPDGDEPTSGRPSRPSRPGPGIT